MNQRIHFNLFLSSYFSCYYSFDRAVFHDILQSPNRRNLLLDLHHLAKGIKSFDVTSRLHESARWNDSSTGGETLSGPSLSNRGLLLLPSSALLTAAEYKLQRIVWANAQCHPRPVIRIYPSIPVILSRINSCAPLIN